MFFLKKARLHSFIHSFTQVLRDAVWMCQVVFVGSIKSPLTHFKSSLIHFKSSLIHFKSSLIHFKSSLIHLSLR